MGKPENNLQRACLEFLLLKGCKAWRNNTGTRVSHYKGKRAFVRYGAVGSGDIFAIVPKSGRFLSIECKVAGKYPSKAQRKWIEEVNETGGWAIVARTVDDVADALNQIAKENPQ